MVIAGPYFLQHDDLIELAHIKVRFRDLELEIDVHPDAVEASTEMSSVPPVKGRVWFAKIASATTVVIFLILLLLIMAHYFGLLNMTDLLPPWLG
jgi:hypothetical protein